jgi:sugar/nucleoside kinase (ribokinase family)
MSILIAGTVAYDTIKTPSGLKENILGGSGLHAAMSASQLTDVHLVSVIGEDFADLDFLKQHEINTDGVQIISGGKTFSWSGVYEEHDMNQACSLRTDLNVLLQFNPTLPDNYKDSKFIFLGNIDPELQMKIINQVNAPTLVAVDTMNFWIESKKPQIFEVLKRIQLLFINDAEIRQLTGQKNLLIAARWLNLPMVIVKKGEHGAMLVTSNDVYVLPAFPLEVVKDPTGAGDTFAGAFMSYLATHGAGKYREALQYATIMASFNVEDFGCTAIAGLQKREFNNRLKKYKKMCTPEAVKL